MCTAEVVPRGRLVMFAGQSNMLGHRLATDGEKPVSSAVRVWDNGGAHGTWDVAKLGREPFNTVGEEPANNMALHFALRLAEWTGDPVFLVGYAVNGSSILSWHDESAEHLARLISECTHALRSAELRETGIERVDTMLWHQGESDDQAAWMVEPRLTRLEDYRESFERMRATLASQPWWAPDTRFIAGELVQDGWLSARNDFYDAGALKGAYDAVASSHGLGHTGDAAHFDGRALQILGERMFEAWVAMSDVSRPRRARPGG